VGNARIAVLNWAVARHDDGVFVLRIEDTDRSRTVADAETGILEDLRWLGIPPDEGPGDGPGSGSGPFGPYRQSDRLDLYAHHAARVLDAGRAYRCFCTPAQLDAERERALAEGRSPRYEGTCRGLDAAESARRAEAGQTFVLRLRTPDTGEIVVDDVIRGRVTFDAADLGDFVIVRSDGLPTYNFAVVVDDAEMEITHVIRGAGHLSNTPYQLLVYEALGRSPPVFAHAPTVLGQDRSKLSKRSGAEPLRALREEGLHPSGVLNYLSLLGWSSPSGEEILTPDRIGAEVTLDRVNAADVVFDPAKMRWLSARHIERMPLEMLVEATRPYVAESEYASVLDSGRYATALEAVRSHLSAFSDVTDHLAPFTGAAAGQTDAPGAPPESVPVLRAVRGWLAELEPWDSAPIRAALKAAGEEVGARASDLYVPVRQVLTGDDHGPPLAAVVEVQGRDRVIDRLDRALREAGDAV
jgi:nondiscriminating glutamyl-tRNA synthetase